MAARKTMTLKTKNRHVAFGGMQAIAEQAHLNTTQLYRTLSPEGNPTLSSFSAILKATGMRISV
jgi:DNA-binding phage protein